MWLDWILVVALSSDVEDVLPWHRQEADSAVAAILTCAIVVVGSFVGGTLSSSLPTMVRTLDD